MGEGQKQTESYGSKLRNMQLGPKTSVEGEGMFHDSSESQLQGVSTAPEALLGDISLLVFRMCQTYSHHGLDEFGKKFISIVRRLVDWFLACFDRLFVEI